VTSSPEGRSTGLLLLILASRETRRAWRELGEYRDSEALLILWRACQYLSMAALAPPEWMTPLHFLDRYHQVRTAVLGARARLLAHIGGVTAPVPPPQTAPPRDAIVALTFR